MANPTEVENWIGKEWEAISSAPISFIVAIIILIPIIWGILYVIFKGKLESKVEQIKVKDAKGELADKTIEFLKLKLEGTSPQLEKIYEQSITSAMGLYDIAVEVNDEPTVNMHERQNPVDTLAELRSEGIHKILNAPVENDDDWKNLQEYQKEWWERVESVLKDNFSTADELNFTRLGVIPLLSFPHTYNDGHAKMLREFAIQDDRLREIIDRNLRQNS